MMWNDYTVENRFDYPLMLPDGTIMAMTEIAERRANMLKYGKKSISARDTLCTYCFKNNGIHRCGRCRLAVYCSKECQTAHWKNPPPGDAEFIGRHKDNCVKKN